MKSENIEKIRDRFDNEWLLIAVDEVDQEAGVPIKGTLINHSKSSDDMWAEAEKHSEPVMVIYSDDWPEDIAANRLVVKKI